MSTMTRREALKAGAAACLLPLVPVEKPLVVPADWFDPHRYSDGSGGYRDCDICWESAVYGCFTDDGQPTQMYLTTDALPYPPIYVCQHCVNARRHLDPDPDYGQPSPKPELS